MGEMAVMSELQIERNMPKVRGWKRVGTTIRKRVVKKDFIKAMAYVQSVAFVSEHADHHPDIDIRWNTVTLVLTTHSEGGLTEKDFSLAVRINSLTS
jgi:4a-hydroxytetrahydrobiopterin dehydratase